MRAELGAAIIALLVAAAQLATVELRLRAARREREALRGSMRDVQRAVGAARRVGDADGERPMPRHSSEM